jgi:purine-binding chemotaxis protein CheW
LDGQANSGEILITVFAVGDTMLGMDSARVQEIITFRRPVFVHHAPDFIDGIINLRGRIITTISLSRKLGLDSSLEDAERHIIIIDHMNEQIGLVIDGVSNNIVIESDMIAGTPANILPEQSRFFSGVYQAESQLVAILNLEAVLEAGM